MDKVPVSLEAEAALLGSAMLGEVGIRALEATPEKAFYVQSHRLIRSAILKVAAAGGRPDLLAVRNALGDKVEAGGGSEYLINLAESVPSAQNATHYAQVVREKRYLRDAIAFARGIVHRAQDQSVRDVQAYIASPPSVSVGEPWRPKGTPWSFKTTGVATPWEEVNEISGNGTGWISGQIHLLEGYHKGGKTALMCQATHRACCDGKSVVYATFGDLSPNQLKALRLYPLEAEFKNDQDARDRIEDWPLRAYEASRDGYDVETFIGTMWSWHNEEPIDMIVVDYLQLIRTRSNARNQYDELRTVSEQLVRAANTMQIPWLIGSQITEGEYGIISKGGRDAEEHSGMVLRVYAPKPKKGQPPPDERERVLEVAFNRFGPSRTIEAWWNKTRLCFETVK